MMFHDVRFPEDIAFGAKGGPEFSTAVAVTGGGFEKRNINWQAARRRFDVGHGIKTEAQFAALLAFYVAREGRAHGFRFKDWLDFQIAAQSIGTGDGTATQFQIFKRYASGGIDYDRAIAKPVAGTVQVFLDGLLQSEGVDYTVDLTTGLVDFAIAGSPTQPAAGAVVSVTCEFDVPVRFDSDLMDAVNPQFDVMTWPNVDIVELRL